MPRSTPKSKPAAENSGVDPFWLLKSLALVFLAALLCTYLLLCFLFHRGQWQIVLHPVHANAAPADTTNLIRFGPDDSAIPQLVGLWLPADPGARYAATTILFLPGGDGSRSDFNPTIEALHRLGLNVFAFDYRGYGYSANTHPNQQKMTQDAESAWRYLTTIRGIPPQQLIPYGTGVGASLATHLALNHPEIPALILDSPHADLLEVARRDPRTSLIPVSLLFQERFPLTEPLAALRTPKLLITTANHPSDAFPKASDPRITVELATIPGPQYQEAVTRFLDQYLPPSPTLLMPTPAPSATNSR